MKTNILIIGAGKMGCALGHTLLHNSQNIVSYWDVNQEKNTDSRPISEMVREAKIIFLCVTSWHIADAVKKIKKDVGSDTYVCALTKGIETTTKMWVPEYLVKHFAQEKVLMLCGPMLADELNKDLPTKAVLAGEKLAYDVVQVYFEKTPLFLVHEEDATSVAMAGVLKNVYAMGLGVADALELGADYKGMVVSSAVQEMYLLIKLLGGQPHVASGYAGLGDLVATGHSPYSRNRKFGEELVKHKKCFIKSEGSLSLPNLMDKVGKKVNKFPLLLCVEDIFENGGDPHKIFHDYLFS